MQKNSSFLKEIDFSKDELMNLIAQSAHFKQLKKDRTPHAYWEGYNIALLFEKRPRGREQPLR